ncbi:MAG TPA: hypothetical protein VL549_01195 [Gemmatimonadales bacterium]|nr:hypothetical protein [Gemmatimonadales bacterium]
MNTLLLLVLSLGQSPAPEAFVPRHATLALTIDYAAGRLAGTMAWELENWTKAPVRTVSFLANRLMEVSAVQDGAGKALRYTQDVVRFHDDPMRQVDQVIVQLPRAIPPGARTTVRLAYGGYLTGYTEVGWLYVKDHIDTAFTIVRADALAFPIVDGIDDSANRRQPNVDFTYDASVNVPSRYVVATGGTPTRTPGANGTVTWRYVSSGPSPFLNIAIAPFDTISGDGGNVHVFFFPDDSAGARRMLADAQRGLSTLERWFGPRTGTGGLTITEIPDGWGSQASAVGGIIQTASAFRDTTTVGELYHELSHLWNARDTDTPSPRWNEGLATFLEYLMYAQLNGWTGRDEHYRRRMTGLRAQLAADSTLRTVPFVDYGKQGMTGASYRVGDLMFATMYELVGADRFNAIIGGYARQFSAGGTTRDFIAFSVRQAPELSALFDDWLLTTRWTEHLSAGSVAELAAPYRR